MAPKIHFILHTQTQGGHSNMSNRTVQNSQLTPGTSFFVRGKLSYARITSQIAGAELRQSDDRRTARGWLPVGRPYTTATINQAQVQMENPQAPTPEQIYAQESLYTSQHSNEGYSYTCNNKGKYLPWVGVRNADGSVEQIKPEGELASGLDVTLCMNIFAVHGRSNRGVTLAGIIIEEPVRYYSADDATAMLARAGITYHSNSKAEAARRIDGSTDESMNMNNSTEQTIVQSPYNVPAQNVRQPQPNIPNVQSMNSQMPVFSNAGNQQGIHYNPNSNINTGNRNY